MDFPRSPGEGVQPGRALLGLQGWTGVDRRLLYKGRTPRSTEEQLELYTSMFPAVEVNSTFYSIPSPSAVRRWRGSVPPGFVFTARMPREISHRYDLTDCAPEISAFLNAICELREQLGAISIQLPPRPGAERLREVARFLRMLPLRDVSFFLDTRMANGEHGRALRDVAAAAGAGVALSQATRDIAAAAWSTAGGRQVYIRWRGVGDGSEAGQNQERALNEAAAIQRALDSGADVYGFLPGETAGKGTYRAAELLNAIGREVRFPRNRVTYGLQRALLENGYAGRTSESGSHAVHQKTATSAEPARQGALL